MSRIIDVHAHLAALPEPGNGCLLSKKMRNSILTKLIARAQGLPLDDPAKANRIYVERLAAELGRSKSVSGAVILAMDGAYDASGRLDEAHTDFLISNDYVLKVAAENPRFLPGVSINPARRDAIDELERCAAKGAALVKVLPNAQVFNPGEARFKPFYRALARLGIPLLSHIGYEFSLIGHDQSVGDPDRLMPALEEGATVIGAHGCSYGLFLYEKHLPLMFELIRRFPRFYTDLSALTLPNRFGALLRLAKHPEIRGRFLFGTDYPLPTFRFPCLAAGRFSGWARAGRADNSFDRQAAVLEELGLGLGADFDAIRAAAKA